MAEKDLSLTILFDIYGGLLSENERNAFEYYYCDDLSLSEISELMKMTRQGVRDNIVRAEKLGLKEKLIEADRLIASAKKALSSGDTALAGKILDEIKL